MDTLTPHTDTPQTHPGSHWYVVHTRPRQESQALQHLERQGFSCYLPRLRMERLRSRQLQALTVPLFPRYLFVRLSTVQDAQDWSPIRSTQGVAGLVCFGGRPAQVQPCLISALMRREQLEPARSLFCAGDRVRVEEGPLAGLEAIFEARTPEQRALILLELLGRPVSVQVEAASLRPIG